MRNVYDTPSVERILDEQATEFPQAPLASSARQWSTPRLSIRPSCTLSSSGKQAASISWISLAA